MNYEYDLDKIKNELTIEQIKDIVAELGGEPVIQGNTIVCKTICHDGDHHKLYYYENSSLFHCFTECGNSFDIFELVLKVKKRELGDDYQLPQAVHYVAQYFGYAPASAEEERLLSDKDFTYFKNYDRIKDIELNNQIVELKEYDDTFLNYLPHPIITPWIKDGISKEIMDYYEICYDPKNCGIVIPHRNYEGKLIGVRERMLGEEEIEQYGKYLPLRLGRKMFNHPLSFNLYGLYQNQENIKRIKKVFVFESEKSVLQYATMFGQENNIAVAICGSSFINYQAWLLINLGIDEIIVGFDHDFKDVNSKEAKQKIKNLKQIHRKYGAYITISFIWDKNNITGYKESPTDNDKEIFLNLFNNRISIYS